jgi:hypothetical protein
MVAAPEHPPISVPGYWENENLGVLRPAIEAYLQGGPMTESQIAAMRGVPAAVDQRKRVGPNSHAAAKERTWLAEMRARVDGLTSREAIERWLDDALEGNIDPL